MNKNALVLENVQKEYLMGEETVHALDGVDLEVVTGSFIGIMGPSGSGKSTLLHLAGILDTPTRGMVFLEGKDITKYSSKEQAHLRRNRIGFIFQRYNLMPQLTALENVLLPMIKPDPVKAKSLLDKLGLSGKQDRFQNQLSGGEQQRVAIARALANDPAIILADEPTGELDTENTRMIMQILQELNQKEGITIVVVTHNPIAAEYVDRTITMQDGKIIENEGNKQI
jgi:putative ABC transport system ATP-binding protein